MSLKISRILHAGYIFETGAAKIAFDPIFENPFSRNCHAFPSVQFDLKEINELQLSAIFISHYHDDHCSMESLNLLDKETPLYMFCIHEEMFTLIRELGFKNVFSLKLNQSVRIGDIEVIPRRALDQDVDSLFQIKHQGLNVLNVVDSWIDYSTLDLLKSEGPWDMVLWPFQTMRELDVIAPSRALEASRSLPPEWVQQIKTLNPKYIVPSSCQFQLEPWSWYNKAFFPITYKQFQKEISEALPRTEVVRLNPGVSVEINTGGIKQSRSLAWIKPLGEQNVDYDFDPALIPPPTQEIARKFPPLSEAEKSRVLEYCQKELIEKFESMEPPEEDYFFKTRRWRLTLFDNDGKAFEFNYLLKDSSAEILEGSSSIPIGWTTEVPLFKLYAALELGEALTSMYVRINDFPFSEKIEEEIQYADIVEDPLIRCLFNGVFGAYQKAQLKEIQQRKSEHRI
ncbi:hypothetical protein AZI85_01505 [Bdellovibrio bacteriovorus]|uniref:Metallo-beta-lactamase domain-containing protein n=1 Tax=Bdellovibrio bacteriovorus TaxID=959 RepID=A0A150WW28_BDEBC|nr:MBL fold metallo-hydrolase [Bdellovibrio bacteriovorus]KYG70639.1 hypothetical protein AZI85_01505 [Bdellovibrio bacteriovorus]